MVLVGVVSPWRIMARQPLMAFLDCPNADQGPRRSQAIGSWDVSAVTDMQVHRAPPMMPAAAPHCDAPH